MTVVKNSLFGVFYLIYLIMLFELIFNYQNNIKIKILLSFSLVELLMLLIKHGFYIVLLVGILILYERRNVKITSSFIPILIFQIGFTNILLPSLKISKGKSAEMLSIPFQQTGMYVTKI